METVKDIIIQLKSQYHFLTSFIDDPNAFIKLSDFSEIVDDYSFSNLLNYKKIWLQHKHEFIEVKQGEFYGFTQEACQDIETMITCFKLVNEQLMNINMEPDCLINNIMRSKELSDLKLVIAKVKKHFEIYFKEIGIDLEFN